MSAPSQVLRPGSRAGGVARLTAALACLALVGAASPKETGTTTKAAPARFEPGACPKTNPPVKELEGAQCGFLTAPSLGEHAAKSLPKSTVVNIPGMGHIVAPKNACGQQVFHSFLASPTSPPDTTCVKTAKPAPFTIQ